jgi:2-keto-myo-inositol isomerase
MIPCINQATLITTGTLKFIETARKLDFPCIELDIDRTEACIKKDGLSSLKATLQDSGLNVISLNAIDNYPILTEDEMSKSLARALEVAKLCNDLDCNILVVNPANFRSGQKNVVQNRFDTFIENVAQICEEQGVKVGYEYVSYDDKVVNTLHETVERIRNWRGNISLVLDVFHMYRSRETFSSLPRDMTQLLLVFHVNDAPPISIEKVVDTDRLFPPDGVINVEKYVQELRARQFEGPVSVELFNKEYWEMDAEKVMGLAKASIEKLLAL